MAYGPVLSQGVWTCIPHSPRRRWAMFRASILVCVLLIDVGLLMMSAVALSLGSAGKIHYAVIGFGAGTFLSSALFYLHKICFPDKKWDKPRNLTLYIAAFILTFATFMSLLVRMCQGGSHNLFTDFDTLDSSRGMAHLSMILASFAILFATLALTAACLSPYVNPKHRPFKLFPSRPAISSPIPGYPTPKPEDIWRLGIPNDWRVVPPVVKGFPTESESGVDVEKWQIIDLK